MSSKKIRLGVWNKLKCVLDNMITPPNITEGEIWWCSCGENIGVEINGKNIRFIRPVLIYHKYNKHSFLGIPLTSKPHTGTWYVPFVFHGRQSFAVLCQMRTFSTKRLHNRMGEIDETDMCMVARRFAKLYEKKLPPQSLD